MATYSWYGGNNEFKDTLGNGAAISGVLRYNNNELTSGSVGTQLFLGFNMSNDSPYPNKFNGYFNDGYDNTKLSCDTTGCSWSMYGVNDDTASPISYSLSQNNTGSSRTIKFKYDNKTIFSIIQAAYSSGTTKITYTFNAMYFTLNTDTDYCLVIMPSTSSYRFNYTSNPILIDVDNMNNCVFYYNTTDVNDNEGIGVLQMSQTYRDQYNMEFVSGSNTLYSKNYVYYFNYTTQYANEYNTITKKFTQKQYSVNDNLALCTVDFTNKVCTVDQIFQFSSPDFVYTCTY